jgi:hypothetical protein
MQRHRDVANHRKKINSKCRSKIPADAHGVVGSSGKNDIIGFVATKGLQSGRQTSRIGPSRHFACAQQSGRF